MVYPVSGSPLVPSPNLPALENAILEFWRTDDTFRASIAQRDGAPEFVFYDGPPFANGLPHYGHLLTGFVKDVVPRFRTMCGDRVDRRFGWDTHGLPAELEAMRELGMTEKSEIEEMGIGHFNAAARASVLKYTKDWEEYVTRQARWVDFDNDYKTLDLTFMESVLWAFKTLYDKGRAYEGYSVLPYCWKDQTPLSSHELRMDDDVYQMRQDPTVTVTFPFEGDRAAQLGLEGVRALAWTTTPWTLPTNFSLAVGPDIVYVTVPAGPEGTADGAAAGEATYLLALDLVGAYAKELGYADADAALAAVGERRFAGSELEYVAYRPLWDVYSADRERWGTQNAWIVTVADYVSTTDGTGVVHQATAYGEEDQKVNAAYGIPVIVSVDDGAQFLDYFRGTALDEIAGLQVFDANRPLIRILRREGRLFRERDEVHSYPHCWRCRNPLIYKAVGSWFVKVADQRERMLELNEQIDWVPGNVKHGQFGKWLEGARDWAVSRNRYWGSPIPVWKSDDPNHPRLDVYGSLAELEADFGRLPRDEEGNVNLHRPYIDDLTRPNPDDPTGRSSMVRITDVFDVWFDSGSMPFAQVHYPFENTDWFEGHNPADFIVEYIGQTRGWFYVMHVLATALFDRPAFSSVICHGIVLGEDGQKMSKSLRNYPDVREMFDKYGADAMRWFLMGSPILRGGNLIVDEPKIRDATRQVVLPLWNVWYFLALYANAAGPKDADGRPAGYRARERHESDDVMDRYLLARTGTLVRTVRDQLTELAIADAAASIQDYLDMLTNWYVRRSRDRFWEGDEQAIDVLHTCLETLCRVTAPLLPMVTEEIWKEMTGGRSVHLTDWPDADVFPADDALVALMDAVREVTSAGNALRKKEGLRARLPLAELAVVRADPSSLEPFAAVIADELNVKSVRLLDVEGDEAQGMGVEQRLAVNARAAGPRLGKQVQQAIKGAKSGDWSVAEDGTVTAGGLELREGEYTLDLVAGQGAASEGRAIGVLRGGDFLVLDTAVTAELEAEGTARDVIRAIQSARRDACLDVSDRIRLTVDGDEAVVRAVVEHRDLVAEEVLAVDVAVPAAPAAGAHAVTEKVAGGSVTVSVVRV
ncbi:isoleucine--tRNA ligase [Brachybacterium huguangmaarense]|uniref:Isoleucine--tRNA ligase n=1 Tax=Brachybacterium huguangmaarense TaxID=1652028 RepID=A0ABY6FX16_9MICO|nr:isoleucine--tRNA ligase [Brachybacterium huguangmaarense]UYG15470.1 isoleucine--tRNA ligase [Brachybacterium huguangmaarense]